MLRATHATYLTVQLPSEVADLIGHDCGMSRELRAPGREVAFLDRGPGFCRVVSVLQSASLLPREIGLNRFIARARVGRKRLFYLPVSVAAHLGLSLEVAEPSGKTSTLDSVVWISDAATYYQYRSRGAGPELEGGRESFAARVYLAKSMIPVPYGVERLEECPQSDHPGESPTPLVRRVAARSVG